MLISNDLVDTIKEYGDYCERQNGDIAEIDKIGDLIKQLILLVKKIHPKIALSFGMERTFTMSGAEQIINRGLGIGMKNNVFYKDIYKDVKKRIFQFAELHGKSEVIKKYLDMDETKLITDK